MFLLKRVILFVNGREDSCRDIELLGVSTVVNFIGVELCYVLPIGGSYCVGLHQFVYTDTLLAMTFPKHIWQRGQQHTNVILLRVSDPALEPFAIGLAGLL